ncbi:MAG: hypothetical protein QOI77_3382 [Blastocatellia bacterium]|nr:hypothetical protein [Blastocatellia bacterium]
MARLFALRAQADSMSALQSGKLAALPYGRASDTLDTNGEIAIMPGLG